MKYRRTSCYSANGLEFQNTFEDRAVEILKLYGLRDEA